LTGRRNYQAFADSGFSDVMANPDLVASKYAFESAKWFFDVNRIFPLCMKVTDDSILTVTRKVNSGTHGLDDRIEQTTKFSQWLRR